MRFTPTITIAEVREDVVEHLGGSDYATGNLGEKMLLGNV